MLFEKSRKPTAAVKLEELTFSDDEIWEVVCEAYDSALELAAAQAFEGRYETEESAAMVDRTTILEEAIALIVSTSKPPSKIS
jgi:hypothetical protein